MIDGASGERDRPEPGPRPVVLTTVRGYAAAMDDELGAPIAYTALERGVDVFSSDGEKVGTVGHVLADEATAIFDGIVVDRHHGLGGHRFVDAPEVGRIHERGVVLRLTAEECEQLPEPTDNPGVLHVDAGDRSPSRLQRAWDRLSGRS